MAAEQNEIDELIAQNYVPGALERKKSILMYMLWGILISLTQGKMTKYEFFHCKQAMGRWVLFFLLLIPSIVLVLLPYVKVLPVLFYAVMIVIWVVFVSQAWDGRYTSFKSDKVFLPLFAGVGGWVVDIFSLKIEILETSLTNNDTPTSTDKTV